MKKCEGLLVWQFVVDFCVILTNQSNYFGINRHYLGHSVTHRAGCRIHWRMVVGHSDPYAADHSIRLVENRKGKFWQNIKI